MSSSGKNSIANFSAKSKRAPPKQPTLITSPMQKMGDMDRNENFMSLRVLTTTPFSSKIGPGDLKGSTVSTGLLENGVQAQCKERPGIEAILLQDSGKTHKRLATVSSHRSFISHGQSSNRHQTEEKKKRIRYTSRHQTVPAYSPTATVGDKEAYVKWKEAPMKGDREEQKGGSSIKVFRVT